MSILKDRLNIDDATCDVFRASCNLLIKGVRANLSLYEIANMCCRTDDLGEIPSTLEKILLNAADLSYHAVDNEKFSHRVASKAIMTRLSVNHTTVTPLYGSRSTPKTSRPLTISSTPIATPKSKLSSNLIQMPSVLSTSSDSDSSDEPPGCKIEEEFEGPPPVAIPPTSSLLPPSPPPAMTPPQKSDSPILWAESILNLQIEQPELTISIPSPPNRRRSTSTDSDASMSPSGFWQKRPSSPVKAPMCGSFTDAETELPSFSLDSPLRTTGEGVLKDVYLAHSNAKFRSSLSTQDLTGLGVGGLGSVIGLTRSCSMEGEDHEGIIGKRSKMGRMNLEEEELIVSAAKALTFIDGEATAGTNAMGEAPKLVKSQSYSALNNATSSNLEKALQGGTRMGSVQFTGEAGFTAPTWGKEKENLVRSYFHKFVDLMLINEVGKRTNV